MLDTFEAITQRRSVKGFDPNHRLTAAEERQLLEAALLSPTAFNIQNWRFILARDPELRQQLRGVAWNQTQVTDASLLVVVCGDLMSWQRDPARYWRNSPPQVREALLPAIDRYYRDHDQVQRDEAMRSGGMAAQTLMLAAKAMGYDSCPMTGFDFAAVARMLNLPKDHVIVMMVAIGKAIRDPAPRGGQLDLTEVVLENRFNSWMN